MKREVAQCNGNVDSSKEDFFVLMLGKTDYQAGVINKGVDL